jgi:predicted HTH transcriptional regulator
MSKLLDSTAKHLDSVINALEAELFKLQSELASLRAARLALTLKKAPGLPATARKVAGRYRAAPTPKLIGKTQKKAFSFLQKHGSITNKQLSELAGNTEKSASNCLSVLTDKGITKRVKPGVFKLK